MSFHLLTQDKRADGDGFLTPPESAGGSPDRMGSWPPRDDLRPSGGPGPDDHAAALSIDDTNCFFPKAAIAAGTGSKPSSETVLVVRERLLELPIIYILILAMTLFWTHVVLEGVPGTPYLSPVLPRFGHGFRNSRPRISAVTYVCRNTRCCAWNS